MTHLRAERSTHGLSPRGDADVGGGAGLLAATILADHGHLRGIVYDLEHAAPAARQTLARAGLHGRCTFESGSFFERVLAPRASDCAADRDDARSDLNMLVGCDGRERTEETFRALLASAGLAWRRTVPLAAGFSALEAARA